MKRSEQHMHYLKNGERRFLQPNLHVRLFMAQLFTSPQLSSQPPQSPRLPQDSSRHRATTHSFTSLQPAREGRKHDRISRLLRGKPLHNRNYGRSTWTAVSSEVCPQTGYLAAEEPRAGAGTGRRDLPPLPADTPRTALAPRARAAPFGIPEGSRGAGAGRAAGARAARCWRPAPRCARTGRCRAPQGASFPHGKNGGKNPNRPCGVPLLSVSGAVERGGHRGAVPRSRGSVSAQRALMQGGTCNARREGWQGYDPAAQPAPSGWCAVLV